MTLADRPNRPLVVKCGYDSTVRRIQFPSASSCRFEAVRSRVEECFHLSASPFTLSYTDDDGEEFVIRSEDDLSEAIAYFVSGDDDGMMSSYSYSGQAGPSRAGGGAGAGGAGGAQYSFQKITIRLDVVLEYDGPSLSDTSSISSFRTGSYDDDESEASYGNSLHSGSGSGSGSYRSYASGRSRRDSRPSAIQEEEEEEELTEYGGQPLEPEMLDPHSRPGTEINRSMDRLTLSTDTMYKPEQPRRFSRDRDRPPDYPSPEGDGSSPTVHPRANHARLPSVSTTARPSLTGPESDPAPSLLTHSELGTRWLKEQSRLATRRIGSSSRPNSLVRRYDSDDESVVSDEDLGNLNLVRDARGKYYYSYEGTDTASLSSRSDADYSPPEDHSKADSSSASSVALRTPESSEVPATPVLAPDCSACGVRLDYMRYVCLTCGEGDLWKEGAADKPTFVPPVSFSPSESGISDSSAETELAAARSSPLDPGSPAFAGPSRSLRSSTSTSASHGSGSGSRSGSIDGDAGSPISPSTPASATATATLGEQISASRWSHRRGYELCPACIEVQGIAHSKAAARDARSAMTREERRRMPAGSLRHTFREKIWGPEGWTDIEYTEESECTICRQYLAVNRHKCVSCPKFDLCKTCYQKVDEIHPAHAFLSLPDKAVPLSGPSSGRGVVNGNTAEVGQNGRLTRHPGAFCHNCLQDIVGPRFHCAVCPSWDLCIQCEGVGATGNGTGHTADHIMMKIPLPLATAEVEAVSRRARDRWFQQDATTVAASRGSSSSRSSSPTEGTVYGGGATHLSGNGNGHGNALASASVSRVGLQRDALDHECRCSNCNEWIMGRRYQCGNCPSEPQAYNLASLVCSICELRSYRIHNPLHVFFKFDRPVHMSLAARTPFLPLLYRARVGEIPPGLTTNPRDPSAYLRHVLHKETLCDIHSDQIRGAWLRCAHCAAGFDICHEAEHMAEHDPTHVFVVFKARVDMGRFRELCALDSPQPRAILSSQVYVD